MIDVCLLGCGGMMPLPHRYLTSLLVRYNGSCLLIDCGEGTQMAMRKKGWTFKPIDVICFTHYHADHVSGLPGLLLSMGNAQRTEPLTIIGPRGLERVVGALRIIAPELPFPIQLVELQGNEQTFDLFGYELQAFKVNHRVTCYGYSLTLHRAGRFDAARAKEQGIPLSYWSRLQKGETITDATGTYTPDMVLGPARKGLKLTYTTDTRPVDSIVDHARGSDLFICEGMYAEPDKQADAVEKKHMTFQEAATLAKKADVGELWLTHYSPSLVRPDEYLHEAQRIFAPAQAGKDGKSKTLIFEEE